MAPIELLKETELLNEKTTLVHATHLTDNEPELIRESGSTVCACPTTEANLGDGFFPANEILTKGIPICLGTDSHAQIDLFQEARLLEIQQRLQLQQRNVLNRYTNREPDNEQHLSDTLLPMMTSRGYKSLGWSGGQLKPGSTADFVVIDLEHLVNFWRAVRIAFGRTDPRRFTECGFFGLRGGALRHRESNAPNRKGN